MADLLLRDVRLWPREPGGESVDVEIRDGRIASIAPAGGEITDTTLPVAHGLGGVLLPAFVDAHAHLVAARLPQRIPPR